MVATYKPEEEALEHLNLRFSSLYNCETYLKKLGYSVYGNLLRQPKLMNTTINTKIYVNKIATFSIRSILEWD